MANAMDEFVKVEGLDEQTSAPLEEKQQTQNYSEGQIVTVYRSGDWRSLEMEEKNYWHVGRIVGSGQVVSVGKAEGGVAYDVLLYDLDYTKLKLVDPKLIKPVSDCCAAPDN
jgi:hypothetical protein